MMLAQNPLVGLFVSGLFFPVITHAVWGIPRGFGQFTVNPNFMGRLEKNIHSYFHVCPHRPKVLFGNTEIDVLNNRI